MSAGGFLPCVFPRVGERVGHGSGMQDPFGKPDVRRPCHLQSSAVTSVCKFKPLLNRSYLPPPWNLMTRMATLRTQIIATFVVAHVVTVHKLVTPSTHLTLTQPPPQRHTTHSGLDTRRAPFDDASRQRTRKPLWPRPKMMIMYGRSFDIPRVGGGRGNFVGRQP